MVEALVNVVRFYNGGSISDGGKDFIIVDALVMEVKILQWWKH